MDDGTSRSVPPPGPAGGPPEDPVGEAAAWNVLARLITGPLLYGGIGYLLDLWLGTEFLVAVGILGGMALAIYATWIRYGTPGSPTAAPLTGSAGAREQGTTARPDRPDRDDDV